MIQAIHPAGPSLENIFQLLEPNKKPAILKQRIPVAMKPMPLRPLPNLLLQTNKPRAPVNFLRNQKTVNFLGNNKGLPLKNKELLTIPVPVTKPFLGPPPKPPQRPAAIVKQLQSKKVNVQNKLSPLNRLQPKRQRLWYPGAKDNGASESMKSIREGLEQAYQIRKEENILEERQSHLYPGSTASSKKSNAASIVNNGNELSRDTSISNQMQNIQKETAPSHATVTLQQPINLKQYFKQNTNAMLDGSPPSTPYAGIRAQAQDTNGYSRKLQQPVDIKASPKADIAVQRNREASIDDVKSGQEQVNKVASGKNMDVSRAGNLAGVVVAGINEKAVARNVAKATEQSLLQPAGPVISRWDKLQQEKEERWRDYQKSRDDKWRNLVAIDDNAAITGSGSVVAQPTGQLNAVHKDASMTFHAVEREKAHPNVLVATGRSMDDKYDYSTNAEPEKPNFDRNTEEIQPGTDRFADNTEVKSKGSPVNGKGGIKVGSQAKVVNIEVVDKPDKAADSNKVMKPKIPIGDDEDKGKPMEKQGKPISDQEKTPKPDVEKPDKPVGELGKPDKPDDELGKDYKPVGELGKPDKPVGELGKPDKPVGELGKPDKPVGGLGKPDKPVGELDKPDKPVGELGKPDKPVGELGKPDKPLGELGKPDKPVDELGKPDKPVGELGKPDMPVGELGKPDKPVGEIGKPDKPVGELGKPEESMGDQDKPDKLVGKLEKPDQPVGNPDMSEKPIIENADRPPETPQRLLEESLLNKMEQRLASILSLMQYAGGLHTVEIVSSGCDHPSVNGGNCKSAIGKIIVDGELVSEDKIGFNVVVLDYPSFQVKHVKTFNTHLDAAASQKMAAFLIGLAKTNNIVLVAINGDVSGVASQEVWDSLTLFGARPPFEKGYRSSLAFIGSRGDFQAPWTQQVQRPAGHGPSNVQLIIGSNKEYVSFGGSGPVVYDVLKTGTKPSAAMSEGYNAGVPAQSPVDKQQSPSERLADENPEHHSSNALESGDSEREISYFSKTDAPNRAGVGKNDLNLSPIDGGMQSANRKDVEPEKEHDKQLVEQHEHEQHKGDAVKQQQQNNIPAQNSAAIPIEAEADNEPFHEEPGMVTGAAFKPQVSMQERIGELQSKQQDEPVDAGLTQNERIHRNDKEHESTIKQTQNARVGDLDRLKNKYSEQATKQSKESAQFNILNTDVKENSQAKYGNHPYDNSQLASNPVANSMDDQSFSRIKEPSKNYQNQQVYASKQSSTEAQSNDVALKQFNAPQTSSSVGNADKLVPTRDSGTNAPRLPQERQGPGNEGFLDQKYQPAAPDGTLCKHCEVKPEVSFKLQGSGVEKDPKINCKDCKDFKPVVADMKFDMSVANGKISPNSWKTMKNEPVNNQPSIGGQVNKLSVGDKPNRLDGKPAVAQSKSDGVNPMLCKHCDMKPDVSFKLENSALESNPKDYQCKGCNVHFKPAVDNIKFDVSLASATDKSANSLKTVKGSDQKLAKGGLKEMSFNPGASSGRGTGPEGGSGTNTNDGGRQGANAAEYSNRGSNNDGKPAGVSSHNRGNEASRQGDSNMVDINKDRQIQGFAPEPRKSSSLDDSVMNQEEGQKHQAEQGMPLQRLRQDSDPSPGQIDNSNFNAEARLAADNMKQGVAVGSKKKTNHASLADVVNKGIMALREHDFDIGLGENNNVHVQKDLRKAQQEENSQPPHREEHQKTKMEAKEMLPAEQRQRQSDGHREKENHKQSNQNDQLQSGNKGMTAFSLATETSRASNKNSDHNNNNDNDGHHANDHTLPEFAEASGQMANENAPQNIDKGSAMLPNREPNDVEAPVSQSDSGQSIDNKKNAWHGRDCDPTTENCQKLASNSRNDDNKAAATIAGKDPGAAMSTLQHHEMDAECKKYRDLAERIRQKLYGAELARYKKYCLPVTPKDAGALQYVSSKVSSKTAASSHLEIPLHASAAAIKATSSGFHPGYTTMAFSNADVTPVSPDKKLEEMPETSETFISRAAKPEFSTLPGEAPSKSTDVAFYFNNHKNDQNLKSLLYRVNPTVKEDRIITDGGNNIYDQGDILGEAESLLQKDYSMALNEASSALNRRVNEEQRQLNNQRTSFLAKRMLNKKKQQDKPSKASTGK
eukprot:gene17032-18746_t